MSPKEGPGPVSLWMTRDPVRVAVTCPVGRVARLMETQRIRHVLVMDGERLAGIVSNRDVRAMLIGDASRPPLSAGSPVSEAMAEGVVTSSPSTPLTDAAREMLDRKIGALPIVEDGRPVGILTKSDALEALLVWVERSR
jgi:acetoin utilization protein AcuB